METYSREQLLMGPYEELVQSARVAGYDLDVDPDSLDIKLTSTNDYPSPEITVTTKFQNGDGYTYDAKLVFPTLTTTGVDYSDSIYYYIEEWSFIGSFIKGLIEFRYDPSEWTIEEEEE